MSINRYGLSRNIPNPIKRQIRQESGFGCVVCGMAIASYEHIEPEFSEAREHNSDKMTYLCGSCHSNVTRGIWSKEKVWEAKSNPFCLGGNRCTAAFDIGDKPPIIWAGSNRFENPGRVITINSEPILFFEKPERPGGPYRLNAKFFNSKGNLSLEIRHNEWFGYEENWDIECVGKTVTIREKKGVLDLVLTASPPKGIIIDKLEMLYDEVKVKVTSDKLRIVGRNKLENKEGLNLIVQDLIVEQSEEGFLANPNGSVQWDACVKSINLYP